MDLSHVLWIGGGQGSGTSSVARALSETLALPLYRVDDHTALHKPRMPRAEAGSLSEEAPPELFDRFVATSRHRFRLVLEDLAALSFVSLVIVEGVELFPTSVAAVLREPGQALFLIGEQCETPFDELVAQRYAWEARDLRLTTLVVDVPLAELVEAAAAHFSPLLSARAISGAGDRSP